MAFDRLRWMLRKHVWKALLLMAVGIAAGFGFSRIPPAAFAQFPPLAKVPPPAAYQSSVSLILNAGEFTGSIPYVQGALARAGTTPALTTLASTYSAYLQSDAFAQEVVQTLDLHVEPFVLTKEISTRLVPNTNVMVVTVRSTSPVESQRLASTVASLFINGTGKAGQGGSDITRSGLLAALQAQADEDKRQITALQQQVSSINQNPGLSALDRSAQLAPLQQTLIGLQGNYSSILNSLANDGVGLGADLKPAQVLDVAQLGLKTPSTALTTVLGGLAGLILGFALMAFLEYLDTTIDSPADLENALAAPVLGSVGTVRMWDLAMARRSNGAPRDTSIEGAMITIRQPTAGVAEAFRLLQTLLQLGTSEPSPRTVLVTSADVGEGKTLVAANLAVVAAQRGKTVILVDADLHRPGIHRLFDLPNDIGLTDLLRLDHALMLSKDSDVLRPVPDVPNLWVLPSGPMPAPSPELLSSEHAVEVLKILPKLVDLVIYDTAPANAVAATLMLARQVDGVIVVARCMQTRPVALQHLGNRLRRIGAHLLGGVLNAVPGDGLSSYSSGSDGRGAPSGDGIPDPLLDGRAATAGV